MRYFHIEKKLRSESLEVREKLDKLSIDQNALSALCLAWQHHKAVIKAKKADRRKKCTAREQVCLEFSEGYLQEDFETIKERIYSELDAIVQSSAMVECINSIIRPYLNTSRGQVNQNMLNLIAFYHNNRRYRSPFAHFKLGKINSESGL
ncbi:MAG: hypothetical protein D3915_16120 [Candidatus Electrothrix sp. AU1_5]|nr:hypothetical protein [Candidatus Electrothrix gigas]